MKKSNIILLVAILTLGTGVLVSTPKEAFATVTINEQDGGNANSNTIANIDNNTTTNVNTTINPSNQTFVDTSNDMSVNNEVSNSSTTNVTGVHEISFDAAASSAAPVFSSACSGGASVQGQSIGMAVSGGSVVCENLMMADAQFKLAKMLSNPQQQQIAIEKGIKFLENAGLIVERTNSTAFIAKVSSNLAIPAGLMVLLFLL
jgi:hypothetical protein